MVLDVIVEEFTNAEGAVRITDKLAGCVVYAMLTVGGRATLDVLHKYAKAPCWLGDS